MFSVSGTFWNCPPLHSGPSRPSSSFASYVPVSVFRAQLRARVSSWLRAGASSSLGPVTLLVAVPGLLAHASRCMLLILGVGKQVLG